MHKRIHTGDKPKKFACSSGLAEHKRIHTREKLYGCDKCDKKFTHLSHLTRHKRIHTGEKPYECDECHKKFTQCSNLTRHKIIHTGEKPYECDECHKKFGLSSNLKMHKTIHTEDKPYECDKCFKKFPHLATLKMHKRIHTKDKPYECDDCKKRFLRFDHFVIHKRIHTGEKPYECDECGKTFSQSSNLKVHKKIHTCDKSDKCNQRFSRLSCLARNKRINTASESDKCKNCKNRLVASSGSVCNERIHASKIYKADKCNKTSQVDNLAFHKRNQTEHKHDYCDVCNRKFAQLRYLKMHNKPTLETTPCKLDVFGKGLAQSAMSKRLRKTNRAENRYHRAFFHKRFYSTSVLTRSKKQQLFCSTCSKEMFESKDCEGHDYLAKDSGKYLCRQCDKQAVNFKDFVTHIAEHHGTNRKYTCSLCRELESTEPTGVGYVCYICDTEFDIPSDLENHMATHDM